MAGQSSRIGRRDCNSLDPSFDTSIAACLVDTLLEE